jgi:hypothetical protein
MKCESWGGDNKWNLSFGEGNKKWNDSLGREIINDILQSSFEEEGDTCISLWILKCDYIVLLYSSKLFLNNNNLYICCIEIFTLSLHIWNPQ